MQKKAADRMRLAGRSSKAQHGQRDDSIRTKVVESASRRLVNVKAASVQSLINDRII